MIKPTHPEPDFKGVSWWEMRKYPSKFLVGWGPGGGGREAFLVVSGVAFLLCLLWLFFVVFIFACVRVCVHEFVRACVRA